LIVALCGPNVLITLVKLLKEIVFLYSTLSNPMFLNSKSLSDPLCNVPSLYPYEISVNFASELMKKEFG
jgi:hypothetical protein